jgi:hypothetical protein
MLLSGHKDRQDTVCISLVFKNLACASPRKRSTKTLTHNIEQHFAIHIFKADDSLEDYKIFVAFSGFFHSIQN